MFKSFLIHSPGVCLITVNMAAGVNRHGIVSAAPVMEPDTLEPPATLVSMWVCVCVYSCVFLPIYFFVPHLNVWFCRPQFAFQWLSCFSFQSHNPQQSERWTFEVLRDQAFLTVLCVLFWSEERHPGQKHVHSKTTESETEKKPKRVF